MTGWSEWKTFSDLLSKKSSGSWLGVVRRLGIMISRVFLACETGSNVRFIEWLRLAIPIFGDD